MLLGGIMSFVTMILLAGCGPQLTQPTVLTSPHSETQLWAIAPFANESGVSEIDTFRVADLFAHEIQGVAGVNVIPVNRVIRAMRELEMPSIQTVGDVRSLMNVLEVDGLIVGTLTAYDPYRPPVLGMAVELHLQPRLNRYASLDTRRLARSISGDASPGELGPKNPVAQAAGVFDAANHRVLSWLDAYATGRHVPDGAYGKDIYLVRMDLYTQFVSYRLLHDLLASESTRLAIAAEPPPPAD